MQFHVATLGCPKNEVISDNVAQLLVEAGHVIVADPAEADWLIVNTCGFIESARDESLDVLQEFAESKQARQKLIAIGCLPQQAGEDFCDEVPGVDAVLGTRRWMEIAELVSRIDTANQEFPRISRFCWEILPARPYDVAQGESCAAIPTPWLICAFPMAVMPRARSVPSRRSRDCC